MSQLKKKLSFVTAFATYVSDNIIGEGGSGRVYQAQDESGKPFAIKLLDPSKATRDKLKRFRNEHAFCSNMDHPNIVKVVDYGVVDLSGKSAPFFVMPLYDGSLRHLMQANMSSEEKLRMYGKVLDGVEAAHLRGVVHRDIKPENILFADGGREIVVADFGIARFAEDELHTLIETKADARLANFLYAAPEQRTPGKEVDARADIFALGLILNELFTHAVPQGTGYRTIGNSAPEVSYLDSIVERMLSNMRKDRLQSVDEVKARLTGHKNEFIARQELDAASKRVLPTATAFGDLYDNAPKIISFDWDGRALSLEFDREITRDWIIALQNMGNYTFFDGAEPARFRFIGNKGYIESRPDDIQRTIDLFKEWIPIAHGVYRHTLEAGRRRAEEVERERLRQEVKAAELRANVLGSVRI